MTQHQDVYLGIDPGSHRIGYGVVRLERNGIAPLTYGVIENTGNDRAEHIGRVRQGIAELCERWRPCAVGVEKLFFTNNRKTAMAVSEMRGVIIASLVDQAVPVKEFTPLQIKQAVCGYGKADKSQVQRMVRMILGITETIRPDDAADGLAIAVCTSATPRMGP